MVDNGGEPSKGCQKNFTAHAVIRFLEVSWNSRKDCCCCCCFFWLKDHTHVLLFNWLTICIIYIFILVDILARSIAEFHFPQKITLIWARCKCFGIHYRAMKWSLKVPSDSENLFQSSWMDHLPENGRFVSHLSLRFCFYGAKLSREGELSLFGATLRITQASPMIITTDEKSNCHGRWHLHY